MTEGGKRGRKIKIESEINRKVDKSEEMWMWKASKNVIINAESMKK